MLPGEPGAHVWVLVVVGFFFSPMNLSYINLLGRFTPTTLASEVPPMIFKGTLVSFLWNAGSREGLRIKNEKLNQIAVAYSLK